METGKKSYILNYFNDSVWLIRPQRLQLISNVLLNRFNDSELLNLVQLEPKEHKINFIQRHNNIGILNIEGVLIPKASWLDTFCGFVSTLELKTQFLSLLNDKSVDKIVLYIDSPGGVSTGILEFAETIYQNRNIKEIISFTDVDMCSAAYWIGSAALKIVVSPSSEIGSIGSYIALIKEKAVSRDFDVYYIQAGDNKTFGNPDIPITESERAYFQLKVDQNNNDFVNAISKYRNIDIQTIKDTKASYYTSNVAPTWMYDELADVEYILQI